jgi:acyl carrier protein
MEMLELEMDALKLEVKRLIIESLELEDTTPDDIADEASLFGEEGLGLDSIDALELGIALRKKYQLPLADNDADNRENFRSVINLARFIQATRKSTE